MRVKGNISTQHDFSKKKLTFKKTQQNVILNYNAKGQILYKKGEKKKETTP